MRYQEPIYIQNENSAVRNKDILNVNMSSDMCVFEAPSFSVSGASKIDCTGSTGTTYVVTTATTIPLAFNFTGNVDTFTATSATFKYEIYKYSNNASIFTQPAVYKSDTYVYSAFSGTNILSQSIPVSSLILDGDYLVKGYFQFSACTDFLGKLGRTLDTINFMAGSQYDIYNPNLDYYFIAFKAAETPTLVANSSNIPPAGNLFQQVILPNKGDTIINITGGYSGNFILTLNGLSLAPTYDYTYTGSVITLAAPAAEGDVITVTYTNTGAGTLASDSVYINTAIVSGTTNNEGSNQVYFNTTTQKYEVYTSVSPATNGSIIVILNGATLANNIDYYQSTSKPKRIILNGILTVGDIVTIVYFPVVAAVNGLTTNNPYVSWTVPNAPTLANGVFTLEVSTASTFSSLYYSNSQPYQAGLALYFDNFTASGTVGTELYYRVKNEKNYENLCGQITTDVAYSEIIPVVIQSNAINSY